MEDKIIIGIDPGTTFTGYGILKASNHQLQVLTMGTFDLRKAGTHFRKLKTIFDSTLTLIDTHHPDELAIESPFYGKNVQSMLKLGRAQGAAIAAALYRDIPTFEYAPRKIKLAITGKGNASKEQVAGMLMGVLHFQEMPVQLDASDALAAALCHYYQNQRLRNLPSQYNSWKDYIQKNKGRVSE